MFPNLHARVGKSRISRRLRSPRRSEFRGRDFLRRYQQKNRTVKSVADNARFAEVLRTSRRILRAGVLDQELRIDRGSETADVDMNEIRRQGQALQWTPPFPGSQHTAIGIFISDFGL